MGRKLGAQRKTYHHFPRFSPPVLQFHETRSAKRLQLSRGARPDPLTNGSSKTQNIKDSLQNGRKTNPRTALRQFVPFARVCSTLMDGDICFAFRLFLG